MRPRPLAQRGFEEDGQKSTHTGSVDRHNDEDVVADAQRAQARVNTGQRTTVFGGSSRVRRTPSERVRSAARRPRNPRRTPPEELRTHGRSSARHRASGQAWRRHPGALPTAADDDRSDVSAGDGLSPHGEGQHVGALRRRIHHEDTPDRRLAGSPPAA